MLKRSFIYIQINKNMELNAYTLTFKSLWSVRFFKCFERNLLECIEILLTSNFWTIMYYLGLYNVVKAHQRITNTTLLPVVFVRWHRMCDTITVACLYDCDCRFFTTVYWCSGKWEGSDCPLTCVDAINSYYRCVFFFCVTLKWTGQAGIVSQWSVCNSIFVWKHKWNKLFLK